MLGLLEFLFWNHDGLIISIAPLVAAGLIAGAGSLLGGGLSSLGQSSANKANLANAAAQREFDLKMWNLNNEYNTPLAQMNRLKDAGLNPNLIYGGGSASTGLSSSYPKASVPHVENALSGIGQGVSNSLNMFYDLKMKDAQINAINNNADLALQKTINEAYKKNLMMSQAAKYDWDVKQGKTLLPFQTSMYEQNIEKTRMTVQDLLWKLSLKNPQEIANIIAKTRKLNTESGNLDFERKWILPKRSANLNADLQLKRQQFNELNPSLLELRMVQKNLQQLNLDLNKGLVPYNMTAKDNILYRLIPGIFNDSKGRKDILFNW